MLDLVYKRWYDPSTKDAGHRGGNHGDSDINRIVRKCVQGDLWSKCDDSLPDHARDKQNYQVHGELAEHGEELERENRVLRLGEVVPEAGHEDDGSNADR